MTIVTSTIAGAASAAAAATVVVAVLKDTPQHLDSLARARWLGLFVGLLLGIAVWIWTGVFVLGIVVLAAGITVGSGIARGRSRMRSSDY
jgi:hypothetical protein